MAASEPMTRLSPPLADAFEALRRGDMIAAERIVSDLVSMEPTNPQAWHLLANVQMRQNRPVEAIRSYDRTVTLNPRDFEAWYNRGLALQQMRDLQAALASYDRAMALKEDFAEALNNRGGVLEQLGRANEALDSFARAVAARPEHIGARLNHALLLATNGRFDEAIEDFRAILRRAPGHIGAQNGLAIALQRLGRLDEALQQFDEALSRHPETAHLHYNRGAALSELGHHGEALQAFDRAIALQPNVAEMHNNRGNALRCLRRLEAALSAFETALSLSPGHAQFCYNRALVLLELGDPDAALIIIEEALAQSSSEAAFHYTKGNVLEALKRFSEALACYDSALRLDPNHPNAFAGAANAALRACDWARCAEINLELPVRIAKAQGVFSPFALLGYGIGESDQLIATERYLADRGAKARSPSGNGRPSLIEKLRIAYLSADFHAHATAYLMAGLIEQHDRRKFEVIGISFGPDDGSVMRRRLVSGFDEFHDVARCSDAEIADLIRALGVNIAIDLKGHTQNSRPAILALRPAPLQLAWLGYPATAGSCGIDYLLADKTVLPISSQPHYIEKIIHLPGCYQVNDSKREIGSKKSSRLDAGLPEDGFVFGCLNSSWKITESVFDIWMRLLAQVPNSVLWLLDDNSSATANLGAAARKRGIDDKRLIFAPIVEVQDHLERLRLADLFLDTTPYNAHTAAADALWAGVPLITCMGEIFAGRVAASLLNAMGLEELVTTNLKDYEQLALRLIRERERLSSLRRTIHERRKKSSLFDTSGFCRKLEETYSALWRKHYST